MKVLVLTESELRSCVGVDNDSLEIVAHGFTKLAQGEVTLPPILRIDVQKNNGEVDVKTAYIHGLENFAIKIASGFLDNHFLGLPTGSGMMVLISAETGNPQAVLLDNGYLTDVRTGIAGAIAAQYLAPQNIFTAGVIGSGMQARFQMRALKIVRDFQEVLVYGIQADSVKKYAVEMEAELGVSVVAAPDPESLVRGSQVVVTTTPSRQPIIKGEWLHAGLHITAMGADAEHKQELFPDVFTHTDLIVCDKKSQVFRLGELHHAFEAGTIKSEDQVLELGQLTSGMAVGRENEHQITVCDLTGVGVQDTQIARLAYRRAIDRGLGVEIGE